MCLARRVGRIRLSVYECVECVWVVYTFSVLYIFSGVLLICRRRKLAARELVSRESHWYWSTTTFVLDDDVGSSRAKERASDIYGMYIV